MTEQSPTSRNGARAVRRARRLQVAIATPLGQGGRGGMDRLTDQVVAHIHAAGDNAAVDTHLLTTRGARGLPYSAWHFAIAVMRLFYLLALRRIDVLHINLAAAGSVVRKSMLARMARFAEVPVVVHIHAGRFEEYWRQARPAEVRRIVDLLVHSTKIIVLGRSFEAFVATRLPDIGDRVVVMPNATPSRPRTPTAPSGETVHVSFLGVLAAQKGVPQLIDALGNLAALDNWRATLAGYGDIEACRSRAAHHGIQDRLSFPGWLSPRDVDLLLSRTHIFVLPSFYEGLPMSILEALSAGIPVIATPLSAIVDVIETERNGLLVPVGDVAALTLALKRLIEDAALRQRLGDAGRADHASRYDLDAYVGQLVRLWQNAAATGGVHPAAKTKVFAGH